VRPGHELFFMVGWDRYGLNKKCSGTCYNDLVFLYSLGSVGHVVHSSASGPQNIDALFFMHGWECAVCRKDTPGHVMLKLCFCIRWDLWVM
jgi:hypothetical protein